MNYVPTICPIKLTASKFSKKWSLSIIRDLYFGMTRFNQFLAANNGLSGKILSERLTDLEQDGFINKDENLSYNLTDKGKDLNEILYSLAVFGAKHFTHEVYNQNMRKMKEDGLIIGTDEIEENSIGLTSKGLNEVIVQYTDAFKIFNPLGQINTRLIMKKEMS